MALPLCIVPRPGKSLRKWTPRDSSRARADPIISRATVSKFCSSQPAGVAELARQDVAAPEGHVLLGLQQPRPVADDRPSCRTIRLRSELVMSATSSVSIAHGSKSRWTAGGTAKVSGISSSGRGRRSAAARAENQPFQQAVRRQPIGPVQAARSHFAGRPEAGQSRLALARRP